MLHLAKDTQKDMLKLSQVYQLKEGFGPPYIYLGANVDKFQLEDGIAVLYTTCIEYMRESIKNIDLILKANKAALKSFGDGYCPYP